jgi:hypothetical protein
MGDSAKEWFVGEIRASGYRMPIALAIEAGDAEGAEAVARKIMRTAAEAFGALMMPAAPIASPSTRNRKPGS